MGSSLWGLPIAPVLTETSRAARPGAEDRRTCNVRLLDDGLFPWALPVARVLDGEQPGIQAARPGAEQ